MTDAEIGRYRGINQFGAAYAFMLSNDPHAEGSVDRLLMRRMIRLCEETKDYLYGGYTPRDVSYRKHARPSLEAVVDGLFERSFTDEEKISAIAAYCAGLCDKMADDDMDHMVFGGTEEQIIARGTDWCTDLARVGCALCQVAGYPCRIVETFDLSHAYSGHVVTEVWRGGAWGVVDPTKGIVCRVSGGRPASAWEIMRHIGPLTGLTRRGCAVEIDLRQFGSVAVVNYPVGVPGEYDETPSSVNDYYRKILKTGAEGWPGGLRWLFGEDRAE